ncbi:MAG: hypothetical protein H7Y06_11225 [Opitutaceae bacterium]|nr:hypothetical protein [Opitutaceae bacterium]
MALADSPAAQSDLDPALNLLWSDLPVPAYLTRLAADERVHLVVGSLEHVLRSLRAEEPARKEAAAVLLAVLSYQDTDPASPTYGIFPWLHEESDGAWEHPDLNTADFAGAALGHILRAHADLLPEEPRARACAALRRTLARIQRRDVSVGYTNIAIMGAGVCVVGGELLGDMAALAYGRDKLERLVAHAQAVDGFSEYNSPACTPVALHECERILALAGDARARVAAEALRRVAWRVIATHFHAGTAQWAGPHSRAHADHISPGLAAVLSTQTGRRIAPREPASTPVAAPLVAPLPCPPDLTSAFAPWRPGRRAQETVQVFSRRDLRPDDDVLGTTWMAEDATLGSVNHDTLRDQRRAIIGYWSTPDDPAVCLRARLLKNGRDWASGYVRTVQRGPRLLASFHLLTNQGDTYPFDRPEDGRFTVSDLRIRVQLSGRGVRHETLPGGRHALVAGERRAVLHPGPALSCGKSIEWIAGGDAAEVWLDAVAYAGGARLSPVADWGPFYVTLGLELLGLDETPAESLPSATATGDSQMDIDWSPGPVFHRRVPVDPEFYPYLLRPDKV